MPAFGEGGEAAFGGATQAQAAVGPGLAAMVLKGDLVDGNGEVVGEVGADLGLDVVG